MEVLKMELKGSCHCQAVRFQLESKHPAPFMRCYCSICRKTNGSGGYGINLGGNFRTLKVEGREHVSVYRARLVGDDGRVSQSNGERSFCKRCGSGLWAWSPDWPDLVHPFASAIDTELPAAPEQTHILLGSKASWVPLHVGANDKQFDGYPDESLAAWHERMGLSC
jgi:hypothetical protein